MSITMPSIAIEALPRAITVDPPLTEVELRSQSDSLAKVKRKMELWMENGAALGWVVNPDTRTVDRYQPDAREIAFAGKFMSGTGAVEGFVLDLEEVWRCYEV